jgi:hypothetical protein
MARQGIRPEYLPGLLSSLYGNAPTQEDHEPWFANEEGTSLLHAFVSFCRKGEFRIN